MRHSSAGHRDRLPRGMGEGALSSGAVNLISRYEALLADRGWVADPAQKVVLQSLQLVLVRLLGRSEVVLSPWAQLRQSWGRRVVGKTQYQPVQGLYVWGGVGRGKTLLMDLFYEACPFVEKRRCHFHRFMREVHEMLKLNQGRSNPLDAVAEQIAQQAGLLCFDEFFVKDIGDAMILANLLKGLFERGVCLVATSNVVPERLYEDGLQRDRFLPAIKLLQQHTVVCEMASGQDFRLRALSRSALFLVPAGGEADDKLREMMVQLSPETPRYDQQLKVSARELPVRALADGVVWFDFSVLCDGPRSVADYIELAEEFTTVIVSGVPRFGIGNDDAARRFIHLVDEFYDRRVKLVLSAEVSVLALYSEGRLAFEFERTISRLQEMQSEEYLALQHAHL